MEKELAVVSCDQLIVVLEIPKSAQFHFQTGSILNIRMYNVHSYIMCKASFTSQTKSCGLEQKGPISPLYIE